jgi:hypothetical protein
MRKQFSRGWQDEGNLGKSRSKNNVLFETTFKCLDDLLFWNGGSSGLEEDGVLPPFEKYRLRSTKNKFN